MRVCTQCGVPCPRSCDAPRSTAPPRAARPPSAPASQAATAPVRTARAALAAAERKLSREADRQNRLFSRALKDVTDMALGLGPDDLARVTPVWAPTRETSDAARADYFAKVASVNPDFADSDIGMMKAGLKLSEIHSLRAYQQRKRAQESIDKLKQRVLPQQQPQEVTGDGDTERAAGQPGTQETAGTGAEGLSGQSR